jgi:uncharacterized protein YbcC (UPF0753/DUF2309 family)
MNQHPEKYSRGAVLHALMHYLPSQAPLKDFIHHNTLHAFQDRPFFDGLKDANSTFGYRTTLSLREYRTWYRTNPNAEPALNRAIHLLGLEDEGKFWMDKALRGEFPESAGPNLGTVRLCWKKNAGVDLDAQVHPFLFRLLGSFLDQGLAQWEFPGARELSFLDAIRALDQWSAGGLFTNQSARRLLHDVQTDLECLLERVVGSPTLYEHYLFDQQFAHAGWSGIVAQVEQNPNGLFDGRKIRLEELIFVELLMEIDALESKLGVGFQPLHQWMTESPPPLFSERVQTEKDQVVRLWQTAYEWAAYDGVLFGIQNEAMRSSQQNPLVFQAIFCIDDRMESFRRHLEMNQPDCQTFGTPGFFGLDSLYLPSDAKFASKICPAPMETQRVVREIGTRKRKKDLHFSRDSQSFHGGFLLAQTLGFYSFWRLLGQLIRPSESAKTSSSDHQMPEHVYLEHDYSTLEMADRLESMLNSMGLNADFAPLVYLIGHGASSTNNPHYAAYDCGACSGRSGSVNARLVAQWANIADVRRELNQRGILLTDTTWFVGALHDTTRDSLHFYDEDCIPAPFTAKHAENKMSFLLAATANAAERSRRFESIDLNLSLSAAHQRAALRSVSLFEPRPELNHATNAYCIVGDRGLTKNLFLDRRAFLNSYRPEKDPTGAALLPILKAAAPVCGGINLEYYFSRVDNLRLGAGSKLPHNVVGLIGVSNGIDGDLRPGLPAQMIEVHDPIRLLMVVHQEKKVVEMQLKSHTPTFQWFDLEWIHLVVLDPLDQQLWRWAKGQWIRYTPFTSRLDAVSDWMSISRSSRSNISVKQLDLNDRG